MTRSADATAPRRNLARLYALEARYEFLKNLRLPIFSLSTILFPVLFYAFFVVAFGGEPGAGAYYIAAYGAFGIMGAALFGFGAGVASERGQGWMLLKRASPMPPTAYFVAKLAMAMAFGAIVVALLTVLGVLLAGVRLEVGTWLALLGTLVAGVVPFCAVGLTLGYLVGPNSAPAVVNLVYLPMAMLSGMWIPIDVLPGFIQAFAPVLPAYHFVQLALGVIGADQGGSALLHWGVLALYLVVFLAAASLLYRRDEGRTYG